jgi:hypothetical protein
MAKTMALTAREQLELEGSWGLTTELTFLMVFLWLFNLGIAISPLIYITVNPENQSAAPLFLEI